MKRVSSASLRCFERAGGGNGGENVKREQTVCIRFIYLYRKPGVLFVNHETKIALLHLFVL